MGEDIIGNSQVMVESYEWMIQVELLWSDVQSSVRGQPVWLDVLVLGEPVWFLGLIFGDGQVRVEPSEWMVQVKLLWSNVQSSIQGQSDGLVSSYRGSY